MVNFCKIAIQHRFTSLPPSSTTPNHKAAGSSVLVQLVNRLTLDVLRVSGAVHCASCFVVPVATGMSIVLTLSALKTLRPEATHVIWSRIDQKSCFKAIGAAGLKPIVVQLRRQGDQLTTDLAGIEEAIQSVGADKVLCVLTTTSCFAPRAPDDLVGVGRICKSSDIPHVVNNAYGVQVHYVSMCFVRIIGRRIRGL